MLSIIIPAHNEEKYILPTIQAIKNQPYTDYEIILVCDGCTDKTLAVAQKQVEKIVVLQERKGPSVAKNEGARIAKGDILVFLDADTIVSPTLLQTIAQTTNNKIIGTAKIKPSNPKLKHKIMMGLKNTLLCPLGVSNGIIFCTQQTFKEHTFNNELQKMEDGTFVREQKKNKQFVILNDYVINSTRRMDQVGYLKIFTYWMKEYFKPSNDKYSVIR